MRYEKKIRLKDGRECLLRNGEERDGGALLDLFILTHKQTDYLRAYPEETTMTAGDEEAFLKRLQGSPDEIEIVAELEGKLIGSAGIECPDRAIKTRHRSEFGISVDEAFWGLGAGRALTKACIECARAAGYKQLELSVVADNKAARSLYESLGFVEYGRNPRGFCSRDTGWQELVLMRMEL